jgi:prolipoprotein diacylglyceryltransferase
MLILLANNQSSNLTIPFEPYLFRIPLNVQVISECLAFSVGFRYYVVSKKYYDGNASGNYRQIIIWGATLGTFLGARIMGFLENPYGIHQLRQILIQFNARSIMGGIFGAMLGIKLVRKLVKEEHLSFDLFILPLILSIFIGRVGCFLNGTKDFTYGTETDFFMAMDLGDGLYRHPIALYELVFLALLFIGMHRNRHALWQIPELMFTIFMMSYFGFRFCIEYLKPNVFFVYGLSSVQWLCIGCWIYFLPAMCRNLKLAFGKIPLPGLATQVTVLDEESISV